MARGNERKMVGGLTAVSALLALAGAAHGQFTEHFDTTAAGALPAGWSTTVTGGAPWGAVSDQANSAPNAVFTNDVVGPCSQYLEMPAIVATGSSVSIDLWSYYDTENTFDGWTVEVSINGSPFANVGQAAWVLNGYTTTISAAYQSPISGQRAFSGTDLTWKQRIATVSTAAGNSVVFRINMSEDVSVTDTGVWIDDVHVFNGGPTGACCKADQTCVAGLNSADCTAQGGVAWSLNSDCASVTCPPSGSCCRNNGTCSLAAAAGCAAAGGVYNGDGTLCANAGCAKYRVVSNIAGSFTDISTTGTVVAMTLAGNTLIDDATGPFTCSVTNELVTNPNLYVTTNGVICDTQTMTNYVNTVLPFTALPNGGAPNVTMALYPMWDDQYIDSPASILQQSVVENGVNVQIIQWDQVRHYQQTPRGSYQVKIFGPGGPALAQFLFQDAAFNWNGNSATVGVQWAADRAFQYVYGAVDSAPTGTPPIANGAVFSVVPVSTGPACYANCDSSTALPFLNVQDFSCFLQKYSSGAAYANCDGSTQPPALNVQDFSCFLQKFSAGCSAP